jgi:N-acetylglucosaminyldiphosphoundecaprenol N-acetyl-beta-D-mannosaminyltransferase
MPADASGVNRSAAMQRIEILGVPVACATYDTALEAIQDLAREARPTAVCPANTHILGEARTNPAFAQVLSRFDLILPDGMPVRWLLNLAGAGIPDRVYGPYLTRRALVATPRPWRHFFLGDTEECLRELRGVIGELNPAVEVAGTLSPPFRPLTEADEQAIAEAIRAADPDFIWVALPGVRMERWIIANLHRHRRGVFLAVGDALALLAGHRSYAPTWMQRAGLTWLYRLVKEPARLGPRYLKYNSVFLWCLLKDSLRGRAWRKTR